MVRVKENGWGEFSDSTSLGSWHRYIWLNCIAGLSQCVPVCVYVFTEVFMCLLFCVCARQSDIIPFHFPLSL